MRSGLLGRCSPRLAARTEADARGPTEPSPTHYTHRYLYVDVRLTVLVAHMPTSVLQLILMPHPWSSPIQSTVRTAYSFGDFGVHLMMQIAVPGCDRAIAHTVERRGSIERQSHRHRLVVTDAQQMADAR
jgi:hypothetical protein